MRGEEIRKELRYNIGMKTLFTIKIDKMDTFNKLRKGPAGKGKFGGYAFRDKTKYSRKEKFRSLKGE